MDVKNLKEVVVLLAVGYEGLSRAKSDNKIDANDIVYLLPILQAIGPALADVKLVVPEAKDLSTDELAELIEAVKKSSPALASETEILLKVQACLNLLRAGKDAYLAFTNK